MILSNDLIISKNAHIIAIKFSKKSLRNISMLWKISLSGIYCLFELRDSDQTATQNKRPYPELNQNASAWKTLM